MSSYSFSYSLLPEQKNYGWFRTRFEYLWRSIVRNKKHFIHSAKVGLALALTTLCILEIKASIVGQNGIWAIMTVAVVFEPTAGATLLKGLNRTMGTFLAGAFVLLGSVLDSRYKWGSKAYVICLVLFCTGFASTLMRSMKWIKSKFDYAIVVFLLTFSLFVVTNLNHHQYGNANDTVAPTPFQTAISRFLMILLGCVIPLSISTWIFPARAGDDLHSLIASHFDKLATCIEGSTCEYIKGPNQQQVQEDEDDICKGYNSLIQAAGEEATLAKYADFEMSCKRLGKPWKDYLLIGSSIRHCVYTSMALHNFCKSEVQPPATVVADFANALMATSAEVAKVLRQLGEDFNFKRKRGVPLAETLAKVTEAATALQAMVDNYEFNDKSDMANRNAFLAFVSHTVETVARLERLVVVFEQVATIAGFQEFNQDTNNVIIDVQPEDSNLVESSI